MVFNMFKGLSRLLSRKSTKTAAPPIVGAMSAPQQEAEKSAVFIDRQTLIVKGVNNGVQVEWWNGNATIHTSAVSANELKQVLRQGYLLSSWALSTRVTYSNIGAGLDRNATVNGLVDVLTFDSMLSRRGNTVYLGEGITIF